jgi:hypothetical protein
MEATIILYTTRGIEPRVATKMYETLFGKVQMSNYGRYSYEVRGTLPEDSYLRPVRAVMIVKREWHQQVIELFDEYGVKHRSFDVEVQPGIFKNTDFF